MLSGRTLYQDDAWNTLCLPYAINNFSGTPLEEATVKTLTSSDYNSETGALTLTFSDNLTAIEAGKPYNGYVSGGLGHANTLFDFGYHLDDGKNSILNIYAHHRAQWGLHALSKTTVGLEFTHPFSTCDLYFGVNGGNIYANTVISTTTTVPILPMLRRITSAHGR